MSEKRFDAPWQHVITLGHPSASEVFVTDAKNIANVSNSEELAKKLTLLNNDGTLRSTTKTILEFDRPIGIASPINRTNYGFISPGTGKTAGGASEFVIPNQALDDLKNLKRRDLP